MCPRNTHKDWTPWRRIVAAYRQRSLLNQLLVCLALAAVIGTITVLVNHVRSVRDIAKLRSAEGFKYVVHLDSAIYSEGMMNYGIPWKGSYREYHLSIANELSSFDATDLRFEADMPAGIVMAEIESRLGCQDLLVDYHDPRRESGLIVKRSNQVPKQVTKTFTEFRNNLYVTSSKIIPNGRCSIRVILAFEIPPVEGYITSQYFLKSRMGHQREMKDKLKITTDAGTKKLALTINTGQHYKSYIFQSENPLRFTENGKVSVPSSSE
jgi:hypothetical protein